MMKHWKKAVTGVIATVFTIFIAFGEGIEHGKELWDNYILSDHISEIELFASESSIIDHRWVDGVLYLKYKTCHPPVETPEYYYEVWIDGELKFHSQSVAPHFSINSWFEPIFCTEGWWGQKGFEGVEVGDKVVVTWHWLIDDGSHEETIMRYIVS